MAPVSASPEPRRSESQAAPSRMAFAPASSWAPSRERSPSQERRRCFDLGDQGRRPPPHPPAKACARRGPSPGCRWCPRRSGRCGRRGNAGRRRSPRRSPCRRAPARRARRPPRPTSVDQPLAMGIKHVLAEFRRRDRRWCLAVSAAMAAERQIIRAASVLAFISISIRRTSGWSMMAAVGSCAPGRAALAAVASHSPGPAGRRARRCRRPRRRPAGGRRSSW